MSLDNQKEIEKQSKLIRVLLAQQTYKQTIDDILYNYSLVNKISNSSLFSNQRLLILKGQQYLGYCRSLPQKTILPFKTAQNIPQIKLAIPLPNIVSVTNSKQLLVVHYQKSGEINKDKNQKWEFKCPNKDCAETWSKNINSAIQQMKSGVPIAKSVNLPQHELENYQNDHYNDEDEQHENQRQQHRMIQPQQHRIIQPQQPIIKNIQPNHQIRVQQQKKVINEEQQLKQRILQMQQKQQQAKRMYEQKKNQQSRLQNQIEEQNSSFINSVLKTTTDQKFLIERLNQNWSYQFAKGGNQCEIIQQFKAYLSLIVRKIVNELGLEPSKRYYTPVYDTSKVNCSKYQLNGVQLFLYTSQLQQSQFGFGQQGTYVSNYLSKQARQQLKNYNYILKLTRNKSRIRVPLCCIIQFKGFIAFCKASIPYAEQYDSMQNLQRELQMLQYDSRINNSIFEQSQIKIVAAQTKIYEKLSRSQNNPRKFDICYVDEARNFLPTDFTRFKKAQTAKLHKLRQQLIQDEQFQDMVFYGDDMHEVTSRIKIPQHIKQGINNLSKASELIQIKIAKVVKELENLDQYFTNSKELSQLLHNNGINMRYIGTIYEKTKSSWIKEMLMSQIVARSAKVFFKFDLQDSSLNLNQKSVQQVQLFHQKLAIKFLNKILGSGPDSQKFWKQLNKQAQVSFFISLNQQELHHGYLLQSLLYHCRIRLKSINNNLVFFKPDQKQYFTLENFVLFQTHSKSYDLSFTDLYNKVEAYLSNLTQESYQQIKMLLNLNRNSIPSHFNNSSYYDKILMFLTYWMPPDVGQSIYYPQQILLGDVLPSKALYQIKLTQIKWHLKNKNEVKSEEIRDWLVDHINKWVGSYFPVLTQLYDIYSSYYVKNKEQQKKAVNYCKSAIKNQEKLLKSGSIKLAQNYYDLSNIFINYGRKLQALNTLKKADQIFKSQQDTQIQPEAYGIITLKIGQLYLSLNSINQALESALLAFSQFNESYNKAKQIQSLQLIGRCYEVSQNWEDYYHFVQQNIIATRKIQDYVDDPFLLEKALKVIIFPYLQILTIKSHLVSGNTGNKTQINTVTQKLVSILKQLPESTLSPSISYNYIKNRILEKSLPQLFIAQLQDIQEILRQIQANGMLVRWKGFQQMSNKTLLNKIGGSVKNRGFDFLANFEALNIFLGLGFLEGVLLDQ